MMNLRSLFLLLLGCLPACAFARQDTNEPLDVAAVRALVPGRTTAREVVEALGAPTDVVQLGRRSAYRYDGATAKSTLLFLLVINFANQDARSDRVWVFFDERDVLTHVGATFAVHRTQYAMPWEDVHEEADHRSRDASRPGLGK
jgi:outer membrane protein assembly factor BamE (lipoprotein component of BamABCDE complex)